MSINFKKTNTFMFLLSCLVSIGGILYGYDVGVIAGALLFIQKSIHMNDFQIGLIVGAVLAGSILGTVIAGPLSDRFGRKIIIIFSSFIFMLGVILSIFSHTFIMLFCARLLVGIGVGIVSLGVPIYVAEIVPAIHRGKYMTLNQLFLTSGILLAYLVDFFFSPTGNWQAMFAVVLLPAAILFFGMIRLPESPRWLVNQNRIQEAYDVLSQANYENENAKMEISIIQKQSHDVQGRWQELFVLPCLITTCIAVAIAIFNQTTGINSFLQYTPLILKRAGAEDVFISLLGPISIGIINIIGTICSLLLIDRIGRRPLLLFGVGGVLFSLCYLAIISAFHFSAHSIGLFYLFGLCTFIFSFAIGPGVVVWLMIAEIFSTPLRAKGMALCLFCNALASTMLATFYLPLTRFFGMQNTFLFFAVFTLCYFVLVIFCLPETKKQTLEEIQKNLNNA